MARLDPGRLAADVVALLRRALTPVLARLSGLDGAVAELNARAMALEARADAPALAADVGALRERVALLEARPLLPGPAGDPGAAGVGFADPPVMYDGQRTFTFCFSDGQRTVITAPLAIYQGIYAPGRLYAVGDLVTANGNLWHCHAATTTAPGTDAAWTLVVRRGKDARKATP